MKRKFTLFLTALALLTLIVQPGRAWGQTRDSETASYGWELNDDATQWTISEAIEATSGQGNTGDYAGKINTNTTTVQFNEKVYVTSFSYAFKRTSTNNNYSVYIETSTDGNTWAIKDTQAMNSFSNGTYRTVTKEFDGTQELYVRFRCNNTTAVRYVDDVTITYSTSAAQLDPCDLALINVSTSLVFDLYDNPDPQVINYTTSSTGEVTVSGSDYITSVVDQVNKTITITPVAVTNGTKVITVNQAADDNYAAGSKTFTINITDSTPFSGGDVTFDATVDKDLDNVSAGEGSITKFGVTFACNNGILGNGSEYRMYKNSTTTFSVSEGTITQIEFTCTSNNPASGFANQTGWTTDGNNGTWTGSAQEVTFTASGAQVRATMIVVTVDNGGTPAPSIVADNVEVAYDATTGSIAYTINNVVAGGTVSAATESDWLTLGQGTASPISFTCTANEAGSARTATVTLTYTYNRATVTKNVTVTQAGNPGATMTIAEVRAQGTGDVATKGKVTSITGSSNKTAYIQDATAAIVVYGNFTASVGDEIGVSGTLSTYNGLLEITNPQVTVISTGNVVLPQLMTIAEINASTNQGWYIRIENATVTAISNQNTTIAQGNNTIVVRGISGVEYAVNDVLSLNGNIGCYNGNQIANPQNVEVQHVFIPTIIFEQDVFNLDAEQILVQQIPFNFENFEVETHDDFSIQFYDVTGAPAEKPEWIFGASVTGTNDTGYEVTLTVISANQGDARSTYFKVYAMVDNEAVYSNIVTINQAEYVAPTYAVLPFSFDGGRNDIANTDGLYQEGLGSDYNTSPKLKFDGDGDWLRLQFNEEPGKLTFDIKGNGSGSTPWAGTFILQTSADGETYTDHATYTELPGTKETFTITNLGSDVRYIQWIYTEKTVGNVALGNINLTQPYTPEAYDLTVEPYENLELFVFIGGDESEMALEGAGTIQVNEGDNVMLSITADEGYEISSLMVDGEEHVNDISDDYTYSFTMPSHNVTISATAVAVTPFEPTTYTLATSIESGKTYIIVGNKTIEQETSYYAMGEQKTNNRAGVAISVDGNTATVDTDKVYELVIEGPDEDGLYTIYDARTPGYLYAASSSANNLKTQEVNDDNGRWAITFNAEGDADVIATESSNRNVMQFNYNGGSPLFNCYASASQTPVYLYVKEEGISTQTLGLSAGTNWVSFNVETNIDDLKAALVAALPGTNITIQSQTQKATYNGSRWTGRLTSIDVANMYKIKVTAACEITLQGEKVNPAELPLTIIPGVNWIAYELEEANAPETVFAGFAVPGDYVKSQTQKKSYNGSRWTGRLNSLEPGQGYIYNSASLETRTFTYPTSGSKGATSNK